IEEPEPIPGRRGGGKSSEAKLSHLIKAILRMKGFTEDDEDYLRNALNLLEEGILPKQTAKTILKSIKKETNHIKIYGMIRKHISDDFFAPAVTEPTRVGSGPREVILSEYLVK
ncbi:MAG: helicase, partial [bacterium]|nr:helicase [bacterium]